jgi:23S rRNA pseudouridine1911/1915/1917 synthase
MREMRATQGAAFCSSWACVLIVALGCCLVGHVDAFALTLTPRSFGRYSVDSSVCWAKPLPTAGMDLQAILASEAQRDLEVEESLDGLDLDLDVLDDEDLELSTSTSTQEVRMYTIPPELNKKRIDAAITALEPELSRSFCGKLVVDGQVRLVSNDNSSSVIDRKSFKVEAGQQLQISLPSGEKVTEILAQNIPLDILFEDEHMIVLNKAANMVVHPAAGNWDGTVVNALAYYLSSSPMGTGDFVDTHGKIKSESAKDIDVDGTDGETVSFRPGIVHRLDKGTTGVLVVAKTTQALAALSDAFASRRVKKTYLTITVGNPGKRVKIDKPIGRHPIHRQRMRVVPDPHRKDSRGSSPRDRMVETRTPSQAGRRALSYVDTIAFDGKLGLVQVRIETGRTHQIRVHLQDRHTPVYGDDVYGLTDWNKRLSKTHQIARPLLHAYRLEIAHPVTGEHMVFVAPLAEDMLVIAKAVYPQGVEELPDIFQSGP